MLGIMEESFEVFAVFQRALRGNASLFRTQTQSDTRMRAFTHKRSPWELVNGREGIKQHAPLCITGCIISGGAGEEPFGALGALRSCLSSRITWES